VVFVLKPLYLLFFPLGCVLGGIIQVLIYHQGALFYRILGELYIQGVISWFNFRLYAMDA